MADQDMSRVSDAFQTFLREAPGSRAGVDGRGRRVSARRAHSTRRPARSRIWRVLAALRLENGVPFHVAHAKAAGATRRRGRSAPCSSGLPAAGNQVTQVLPAALAAYDEA